MGRQIMDNYQKIAKENLDRLYSALPADLDANLPARREGDRFVFNAFGGICTKIISLAGAYA